MEVSEEMRGRDGGREGGVEGVPEIEAKGSPPSSSPCAVSSSS